MIDEEFFRHISNKVKCYKVKLRTDTLRAMIRVKIVTEKSEIPLMLMESSHLLIKLSTELQ